MSGKMLHVDMDAFFVSVELLRNPALRGRLVVVGSPGPRGVISSASYETRKFGICSGMASSRARLLCPGLIFLSGNVKAYAAYSREVEKVLRRFSPCVEPASIDEFYVDLSGCERLHGNFFEMGESLFRTIKGELGLSASMGLASNRALAKIASRVAKPHGLLAVTEGYEEAFMESLSVGLIPGVGPVSAAKLSRMGVKTAGDLAALPLVLLEMSFGSRALGLHLKARGLWRGGTADARLSNRSIGHERTFPEDVLDPLFLETALFRLAEKSAVRLRSKGLETGRVTVKVRYSNFETVSFSGGMEATALEQYIFRRARPLMAKALRRRLRIRLLGLSLSELGPAGYQADLFGGKNLIRRREACRCLDLVKNRFGFRSLCWAAGMNALSKGGKNV